MTMARSVAIITNLNFTMTAIHGLTGPRARSHETPLSGEHAGFTACPSFEWRD